MRFTPWMAAALALVPLLQACGGGSSGGSGTVRFVNATDDYASLDFYTSSNSTDSLVSGAITTDTASAYTGLDATTYVFNVKSMGSGTTLNSSTRTVLKDASHSLVAYSTSGLLKSVFLTDNEVAPTAGTAKLRIFNASNEAGAVDVYVTTPAAPLASSAVNFSALAGERISGYTEFGAGSYEIRVTGAGQNTDLRLDLPSVALQNQQVLTLVLTSSSGGVLVHGRLIDQGKTVTPERNPSARVRLVAGASGAGAVAAVVNGLDLAGGSLVSPGIGSYKLVPAGTLALTATLNGAAAAPNVTTPLPTTLAAGSDGTLLINGSGANGVVTLFADDNRPPQSTANAKLRLVHGVANLASPMTLTADFSVVASNITTNNVSTPLSIAGNLASTTTQLTVTSPGLATNPYNQAVTLLATHPYTVFVLGDAATPIGVLVRDR